MYGCARLYPSGHRAQAPTSQSPPIPARSGPPEFAPFSDLYRYWIEGDPADYEAALATLEARRGG
jgi:hypothetical protein